MLGEQAYGLAIHDKVLELGDRKSVNLGALYGTLDRLEDKGYVTSWLTEPLPERGGRSRRCYRLKAFGERALRNSAETAKRVYEAVDDFWRNRKWGPTRAK